MGKRNPCAPDHGRGARTPQALNCPTATTPPPESSADAATAGVDLTGGPGRAKGTVAMPNQRRNSQGSPSVADKVAVVLVLQALASCGGNASEGTPNSSAAPNREPGGNEQGAA